MRYALVATTSWLLLVDLKSKQVQPVEKERPEYYGISWFPGDKELVLSHSGLDNASLVDIAAYAQSETGWLSKGGLSSRTFLSQPHQILCAPDGKVIGVRQPFGAQEIKIPYAAEVASAAVGDTVLVVWWGSMSNAKAWFFGSGPA